MGKAKDVNDPAGVTQYIQNLNTALKDVVEAIRQTILNTDALVAEQIKWNSPSFFYQEPMPPFDPKEYKRDIVVLNLRSKDYVLLVFPTGAKLKDDWGLLEGDFKDGRRVAKIYDITDLKAKEHALQQVITAWLKEVNNA